MTTLLPTPKVAAGGATGILTGLIFYELDKRFQITVAPEEAVFISTAIGLIVQWFAPHSEPTPEQKEKILADQCPSEPKQPNLSTTQWADPTTPL